MSVKGLNIIMWPLFTKQGGKRFSYKSISSELEYNYTFFILKIKILIYGNRLRGQLMFIQ